MAHLFRPVYTQLIPPHAIPLKHKGKPAVRWKARGNRIIVGVVCADNPARCRVEGDCWWVAYTDAAGAKHKVKAYPDKAASEGMLAKLVQQTHRIAAGVLPPEAARERLTLPELFDRWRDYLVADGGTEKHAKTQHVRINLVATAGGFVYPADFKPAATIRALAKVRADLGLSGRTADHYLGAVKAFARWCAVSERCEPVDPLSGVSRKNDDTDPRHVRRVLSQADFDRLIDAVMSAEISYGLTGPERAALYLLASSTGLRASELASLTVGSFDGSTVTVAAAYAKGKRRDTLDVHAGVMPHVAPLLKGKKTKDKVWPDRTGNKWATWRNDGARMLELDLAIVGIPYADEQGRVYDFHALRSQFATDLDRAGVSLGRAQKLMRHSVPSLTSKHYTRPDAAELSGEVNKLKRG